MLGRKASALMSLVLLVYGYGEEQCCMGLCMLKGSRHLLGKEAEGASTAGC